LNAYLLPVFGVGAFRGRCSRHNGVDLHNWQQLLFLVFSNRDRDSVGWYLFWSNVCGRLREKWHLTLAPRRLSGSSAPQANTYPYLWVYWNNCHLGGHNHPTHSKYTRKKLCWKCKHVVNLFCHNSSLFWDKFINKRFFFSVKLLVQISKCKCTSREQQSKVWGRNLYCFSFVDADTLPRNYLRRWCVSFAERLVYYLVIGLPNYLSS